MSFSEETIQKVWEKGKIVDQSYANEWRKDQCDAWIKRTQYGNRDSLYGWEIDHVDPDGGDNLANLRPLQWKNNVVTGEGRLQCPVTAEGNRNVERN